MISNHFLLLVSSSLIGPLLCSAAELTGVILDPQDFVISGVTVTLACRGQKRSIKTDPQGRFAFPLEFKTDGCIISAFHRGFSPFQQVLGPSVASLSIRLTIEPIRDTVTVAANSHDEGPTRFSTLTTVALSEGQLKTIAASTQGLIEYAKLLSGTSFGSDVVYVDGVPAGTLPPAAAIEQIKVNADPFSARHADGNQNRIDILTKEPDRQFRVNLGAGSLAAGGGNPIARNLQSKSHSGDLGLAGSIPMLPLTLSLQLSVGNTATEVPIRATVPVQFPATETVPRSAFSTNRSVSATVNVACQCPELLRPNLWYSESHTRLSNLGVGALVLPDAGFGSSYTLRSARLTLNHTRGNLLHRIASSVNQLDSDVQANTGGLGLTVIGHFNAGGAAMLRTHLVRSTSNCEALVEPKSARLPWTVGLSVAAVHHAKTATPNPAGTFTFHSLKAYTDALAGKNTADWLGLQGRAVVRYLGVSVAPFVEKEMYRSSHSHLRGGLRGDYQSGWGIRLSPRLAGVLDWRGFLFRAGAGIFVYDVPSEVIVSVLEKDGMHLKEFRNFGVPLIPTGTSPSVTLPQVRVRVSPDVTRPADLLAAASVQRRLRHVSPAAEYTWTRGRHLLGSRRLPDGSGWSDVLESNRSAERHRLRTRLAFTWKAQTFTAQYEWLRSRDDVDGPFSFPEHQEDLRSEWAFSSAIPRHVFTLVGNLRFPGAVSVTLTDTWRGPAPYNITTGMDLAGNALYNDRGGRARNTGQGPPYQSLSLFAHRRIVLPNLLAGPPRTICLDLGVHLDNLLGHRNLLNVGPIAGSGTFGLPLAALPGRSVRLSFSFN